MFFDWNIAVECALAFVCLKDARVPPVCISCIAIKPGPVFVVVGDVAQSMVSWRSMVVVEKKIEYHVAVSERVWRVSTVQNFLSITAVTCNCIPFFSPPISAMSSGLYEVLGIAKDASPEQGMSPLSLANIAQGLITLESPQSLQEESIGDSS